MIPQRWKDDPLSAMLTISAVILIVLYGLEEWRRSVVADANKSLQTISIPDSSCRLATAGLRGETLVIACPDKTVEATRIVADTIQHPFERVVVVGSDGRTPL